MKKLISISILLGVFFFCPISVSPQEIFSEEELRKIASLIIERESYQKQLEIQDSIISHKDQLLYLSDLEKKEMKEKFTEELQGLQGELKESKKKLKRTKVIGAILVGLMAILGIWT